jgi:hypothetical protein
MADPQKVISTDRLQEANLLHSPQSNESVERVKWEAQYTPFGPPGRPYVKRDYPMMMFLAGRPESGMGPDTIIEQEIVEDSGGQEDFLRSRGFRETPLEAIKAFQGQQLEFAKLAANLEYQKKNQLSPRAAAEVEAAQEASAGHLPMVPETPIKPRAK